MKTLHPTSAGLSENGINSRLDHKNFIGLSAKTPFTKTKKIVRNIDRSGMRLLSMLGLEQYTLQSGISIHPEFIAYSFHLYGLSRKLFLYIVFFEVDNDTCKFAIDQAMMRRFREFCLLFEERDENDKSIQQSLGSLIRKNIMTAHNNEKYMLNPLIAGGSTESKRRKLIDIYCKLLENKGLDASDHFYPRYHHTL